MPKFDLPPAVLRQAGSRGFGDDPQCINSSIGFTLLKVTIDARHLIGDMSEAYHRLVASESESIERRSFHFDRNNRFAFITSTASAVSRKGASVVQVAPTATGNAR